MGNCCENVTNNNNQVSRNIDDDESDINIGELSKSISRSKKFEVLEKIQSEFGLLDDDSVNDKFKRLGSDVIVRKVKKKLKQEIQIEDKMIYEKIKRIETPMKQETYDFLEKILSNHFVFSTMSDNEKSFIIKSMFKCIPIPGEQYIFQQNDRASCFFIIVKGEVQVEIDRKVKKAQKPGQYFGEQALLYNSPRSAGIIANDKDLEMYAIDRVTFQKAIQTNMVKNYEDNRAFIELVHFFQSMTENQKDVIASVLILQIFKDEQVIVNIGDQASSYYQIREGTVSCYKDNKELRRQHKGDSFGEQALYFNSVRTCSVKAIGEATILALGREPIQDILGGKIQDVIFKNYQRWAIQKSPIFSKFSKITIEKLLDKFVIRNTVAGDLILKSGRPLKALYICLGGSMKYDVTNTVYEKYKIFDEKYLYPKLCLTEPLDGNLKMMTDGIISELSIKSLLVVIGGSIEKAIAKNEENQAVVNERDKNLKNQSIKLRNINWNLKDFVYVKNVGQGQFGHVLLVYYKPLEFFFALKTMSLSQIDFQSQESHIMYETKVLSKINSTYMVSMVGKFRDDCNLYLVLEWIKGIELFDAIRRIDLLNNCQSQFYVASLIQCLEYQHSTRIIYRDLKPENVLIDKTGYLKQIDMGTAKIMERGKGQLHRTFTILGTPHYMAPEILLGKGYSYPIDLWSLGICLYEFMCGMVPFGEELEDPYQIYNAIATQNLQYPPYFPLKKNKLVKIFIEQLLNRIPDARTAGSYEALKANAWYDDFEWDQLILKELKPPYIPPNDLLINDSEIDEAKLRDITLDVHFDKKCTKKDKVDIDKLPNIKKEFIKCTE